MSNKSKEVITLHFQSSDQLINYAVRCDLSHRFNLIANQIFEKEPKFIENGFYFLSGGKKINEYKTIKDNQLKNNGIALNYRLSCDGTPVTTYEGAFKTFETSGEYCVMSFAFMPTTELTGLLAGNYTDRLTFSITYLD